MKVTLIPAKRREWALFDKGKIVIEAFEVPRNISKTSRKYDLTQKQIRRWKRNGHDIDYLNSQVNVAQAQRVPDAVRANSMNVADMQVNDDEEFEAAIKRQMDLKKRRRISRSFRMEGAGRKTKFSNATMFELKGFFYQMRREEFPVEMKEMMCQAMLLDPNACTNASLKALEERLRRCLEKWGAAYRRGTHKAQEKKLSPKTMSDFNGYIKQKCLSLGIPDEAVYNFDETNVSFFKMHTTDFVLTALATIGPHLQTDNFKIKWSDIWRGGGGNSGIRFFA